MGFYVERTRLGMPLEIGRKCEDLLADGAVEIFSLQQCYEHMPHVVCVVDNLMFDAALVCYNDAQLRRTLPTDSDPRPRRWFHYNIDHVPFIHEAIEEDRSNARA